MPDVVKIHTLLELTSAMICFGIAFFAWRRNQEAQSRFNLLWMWAFIGTGVADLAHAVWSRSDHADMASATWTWAISRGVLMASIMLAVVWSRRRAKRNLADLVLTISFIALFLSFVPSAEDSIYWMQSQGIVHRPIDAVMMVPYVILLFLFRSKRCAVTQAPRGFALLMAIAVATHAVMAFGSQTALDGAFITAHLLKVLWYGLWLIAVWFQFIESKAHKSLPCVLEFRALATAQKTGIVDLRRALSKDDG